MTESCCPNTVPDENPVEVEYSTKEEEFSFVAQVMIADLEPGVPAEIVEIVGAVVSAPVVVNEDEEEVVQLLDGSQDFALKLYVVPEERPTSVIAEEVANVVDP